MLSRAIKPEERNKRHPYWKGRREHVFTDRMILYTGSPKRIPQNPAITNQGIQKSCRIQK